MQVVLDLQPFVQWLFEAISALNKWPHVQHSKSPHLPISPHLCPSLALCSSGCPSFVSLFSCSYLITKYVQPGCCMRLSFQASHGDIFARLGEDGFMWPELPCKGPGMAHLVNNGSKKMVKVSGVQCQESQGNAGWQWGQLGWSSWGFLRKGLWTVVVGKWLCIILLGFPEVAALHHSAGASLNGCFILGFFTVIGLGFAQHYGSGASYCPRAAVHQESLSCSVATNSTAMQFWGCLPSCKARYRVAKRAKMGRGWWVGELDAVPYLTEARDWEGPSPEWLGSVWYLFNNLRFSVNNGNRVLQGLLLLRGSCGHGISCLAMEILIPRT